eukprot:354314-Chlamydomonas_euryale.AAC.10
MPQAARPTTNQQLTNQQPANQGLTTIQPFHKAAAATPSACSALGAAVVVRHAAKRFISGLRTHLVAHQSALGAAVVVRHAAKVEPLPQQYPLAVQLQLLARRVGVLRKVQRPVMRAPPVCRHIA